MEKIRMAIIDADATFVQRIEGALQRHGDIEIIGTAADGASGLELVRKKQPDAVLFDLILPGLDGISVLKELCLLKKPPMAICCTQFYSSVSLEICRNLGAAYFLYKPVDCIALPETIRGCYASFKLLRQAEHASDAERSGSALEIRNFLVSLGIPSRLIGCSYLAEAIRLAQRDVSLTQNLSKGLYLEISRSMNTTPVCIERSIRSAISAAYQSGRLGEQMITCPSNKEFINYVLRACKT